MYRPTTIETIQCHVTSAAEGLITWADCRGLIADEARRTLRRWKIRRAIAAGSLRGL